MSKIRRSSVNLGSGSAGLSTVGYTLYNFDGTEKQARSTTNVTELGTNTGVFVTTFSVDDAWDGTVLWDTGEATPYYAQDDKFSIYNTLEEETSRIRTIWNTIKNHTDYEAKVLQEMTGIKDDMNNKHPEVLELTMKNNLDKFNSVIAKSVSKELEGLKPVIKFLANIDLSMKDMVNKVSNISKDVPLKYTDALKQIEGINKEYSLRLNKTQLQNLKKLDDINNHYNKLLGNVNSGDIMELANTLKEVKLNLSEIETIKQTLKYLLDNLDKISRDISISANEKAVSSVIDSNLLSSIM